MKTTRDAVVLKQRIVAKMSKQVSACLGSKGGKQDHLLTSGCGVPAP